MAKKTTPKPEPKPETMVTITVPYSAALRLVDGLWDSVGFQAQYAAEAVERKACVVRDWAERARVKAQNFNRSSDYTGINGLGELQGVGPEFDVLCAKLVVLQNARVALVNKAGPIVEALIAATDDSIEHGLLVETWAHMKGAR